MKNFRKIIFKSVLLGFVLMFSWNAMAVPAYNKAITVKQSNGKTLTYFLYGDEHVSWARTLDGYTVMHNAEGDLVYAVTDQSGDMVMSSVIASDENIRSKEEKSFVSSLNKEIFYSDAQLKQLEASRLNTQEIIKSKPVKAFTKKDPKFLVVLVSYSDVEFGETNAELFKHQIQDSAYTDRGYTGSVRDYFADQSYNTIDPQFDVYGPITLPQTRSYYAGNNNYNSWQMVRDAVKILDTLEDVDFSVYDNDDDGIVDLVHVIYAGQGANTSGNRNAQVWPHMSQLSVVVTLDGKRFRTYACSSEHNGNASVVDGVGAVCHEMGHAFGLPDMYDTGYSGAVHPASWDIMAAGSYNNNSKTPPYYSMVERDMLGWGNIITLEEGTHNLYPIADSNTAYKIHLDKNEYLMFEYRNHDKWDAYIPGVGMLVWHADTSQFVNWIYTNDVNGNADDRGYYIECAGDEKNLETPSTPYPGSLGITDIPYFYMTDGTAVDGNIADIHYDGTADSTIIFTYRNHLPVRFDLEVSDITVSSATVSGSFSADEGTEYEEKILQYKKHSLNSYTSVDITDDEFTYQLNDLEISTSYDIRLVAKVNSQYIYSVEQTFHTACSEGAIDVYPWDDSFEDGVDCWTQESTTKASWKVSTSAIGGNLRPYGGKQVAELKFTSSERSNSSARLISPVFDLSGYESAKLYFAYAAYSGASAPLVVYYRTSPEGSWTRLKNEANTNSGYYSINWKRDSIAIPELSSTLQISFVGTDNAGYGVALDAVRIKTESSVGLNDAAANEINFKVIPNPSDGDATVALGEVEDNSVMTVCDALGRILYSRTLTGGQKTAELKSSELESGVYYIKVVSGNKVYTEKFIKR